jgi:predicted metal-dependent hydrolase
VQLEFLLRLLRTERPPSAWLMTGGRPVRLQFVRHRRARRYILRLAADGAARVTIPRGGSEAEARRFAERHAGWLQKQLERRAARPPASRAWRVGSEIHFRGQLVRIEVAANGDFDRVSFGGDLVPVPDLSSDLRPAMEGHLRGLAEQELPGRVMELAALHGLSVRRVTVRDQRSRWGSCSRRGTVSLNWRLVQTPPWVSDYLILHELMHLREMNHSRRFWREVQNVCPGWAEAERWLKQHSALLR